MPESAMRGMLSASVIRKDARSIGLPPALTISTHSSSRDENAPDPSQSRAGPARISLIRSEAAHAGRASDAKGMANSVAVRNNEASLMTGLSAGAEHAGAVSAQRRGGKLRVRDAERRRARGRPLHEVCPKTRTAPR